MTPVLTLYLDIRSSAERGLALAFGGRRRSGGSGSSVRFGDETVGGREARLDIDGHGGQPVERLLHRRPHDAKTIAERFGPRVAALRLDRHDLARQSGHAVLDLGRVHGERAVR